MATKGVAMGQAIAVRTDYTAGEVRRFAKQAKDVAQARRLLAIAAVLEGASRTEAAKSGGMDRQTLRDWVIRFNDQGRGDPHRSGVLGPNGGRRFWSWLTAITAIGTLIELLIGYNSGAYHESSVLSIPPYDDRFGPVAVATRACTNSPQSMTVLTSLLMRQPPSLQRP
jgi:Winged helix-turn helix